MFTTTQYKVQIVICNLDNVYPIYYFILVIFFCSLGFFFGDGITSKTNKA